MATKFSTRIKVRNGKALCLVNHPMLTGNTEDRNSGKRIPAHFIETLVFSVNGSAVAEVSCGTGVSKNPVIGIQLPQNTNRGDLIEVTWSDNQGNHGSARTTV